MWKTSIHKLKKINTMFIDYNMSVLPKLSVVTVKLTKTPGDLCVHVKLTNWC